jgi:single-strand DNA-binding protein
MNSPRSGLRAGACVVAEPPAGQQGLGSVSHLTRGTQEVTADGHPHRQRPHHPRRRAANHRSSDSVATVSVASDRRDRKSELVYVALVLWRAQAKAAAQHLVKGQAVAFSGRFEPREYTTRDGRDGVTYELHDVALEYGAKPRGDEPSAPSEAAADPDDIPF